MIWLRVLGLWLLYAAGGLIVAVAAAGTTSDLSLRGDQSPTRLQTKIVGGLSGLLLALGAIGLFLLNDPKAGTPALARTLAVVGSSAGGLLMLAAWWMIARDLRPTR